MEFPTSDEDTINKIDLWADPRDGKIIFAIQIKTRADIQEISIQEVSKQSPINTEFDKNKHNIIENLPTKKKWEKGNTLIYYNSRG